MTKTTRQPSWAQIYIKKLNTYNREQAKRAAVAEICERPAKEPYNVKKARAKKAREAKILMEAYLANLEQNKESKEMEYGRER